MLSFFGFLEKHPQPVGKVSLLEWLFQGYPENSIGEVIYLLLINWCNLDWTGGSIRVDATPWMRFCQWTWVDENPWMQFCWLTQCSERGSICHICWAHYEIKVQEAERPYSESGKWRRVTWYNLHFLNHHLTIYSFVSFMFSMLNMKHLLSFLFKLCFSFISNQSSFLWKLFLLLFDDSLFLWTTWLWRSAKPKANQKPPLLTGVSYPGQESGESETIPQPQCDLLINLSIQKLSFIYPSQNKPSIFCPCLIQPKSDWSILGRVSSSGIRALLSRSIHFWVYFLILSFVTDSLFFWVSIQFMFSLGLISLSPLFLDLFLSP